MKEVIVAGKRDIVETMALRSRFDGIECRMNSSVNGEWRSFVWLDFRR